MWPLHGTTKGTDIYEVLKKSTDNIGGLEKCSAIVTDGAPSMVGENTGLVGLLRKDGVTCPTIHCIIHQSALCGKSIKRKEVFKVVVKTCTERWQQGFITPQTQRIYGRHECGVWGLALVQPSPMAKRGFVPGKIFYYAKRTSNFPKRDCVSRNI